MIDISTRTSPPLSPPASPVSRFAPAQRQALAMDTALPKGFTVDPQTRLFVLIENTWYEGRSAGVSHFS